jgi:hypothetical protein
MLGESTGAGDLSGLNVVEILKLGVSGLVFLLAFLGYNLLRNATQNNASVPILAAVRFYMWIALTLAGVVTVGGLAEHFIASEGRINDVRECRNSLARLDTQSKMPDVTVDNLRHGIAGHLAKCEVLLEHNDAP